MKKRKKLAIRKVTLRNLEEVQLGIMHGGATAKTCLTACGQHTCANTCVTCMTDCKCQTQCDLTCKGICCNH